MMFRSFFKKIMSKMILILRKVMLMLAKEISNLKLPDNRSMPKIPILMQILNLTLRRRIVTQIRKFVSNKIFKW